MSNKEAPLFPSTDWAWDISNDPIQKVKIIHPEGMAFISPVELNRFDRLQGHDHYIYKLTEKDSFLLSYTIDYFHKKSRIKGLSENQSMILASNIVCAYRFRQPLGQEIFEDMNSKDEDWRKFGEHLVRFESKEYEVFVIGHEKGTLIAVSMEDMGEAGLVVPKLELIELPRNYFKRYY